MFLLTEDNLYFDRSKYVVLPELRNDWLDMEICVPFPKSKNFVNLWQRAEYVEFIALYILQILLHFIFSIDALKSRNNGILNWFAVTVVGHRMFPPKSFACREALNPALVFENKYIGA